MICPNCNTEVETGTAFCTNCGTKLQDVSKQTCTIKVNRPSKAFGFAISFEVLVDDFKIGVLNNGAVLECSVEPGVHKVSIKSLENVVDQEVTLEANKSVELQVKVGMGIVAGRPKIFAVNYN